MSEILKTPEEWCKEFDVVIRDPDGWRNTMYKPFDEPLTLEEFQRRLAMCTISVKPKEQ